MHSDRGRRATPSGALLYLTGFKPNGPIATTASAQDRRRHPAFCLMPLKIFAASHLPRLVNCTERLPQRLREPLRSLNQQATSATHSAQPYATHPHTHAPPASRPHHPTHSAPSKQPPGTHKHAKCAPWRVLGMGRSEAPGAGRLE